MKICIKCGSTNIIEHFRGNGCGFSWYRERCEDCGELQQEPYYI